MLLSRSTAKRSAPQQHTDVRLMIVSSKTRMTIMIMIMVICKCSQSDSFPPKYISAHNHKEPDLCECCLRSIFLHGCLRSDVIFFHCAGGTASLISSYYILAYDMRRESYDKDEYR